MLYSPQQFLTDYQGQSLLVSSNPADRGQCVQSVSVFVKRNNQPIIYANAINWRYTNLYDWIDNSPSAVPPPGALIIWGSTLPGSGGSGHIAVNIEAYPGTGTFKSVDSNWGGKYVHAVIHNYNYVEGWLVFKTPKPPITISTTPQQGEEMITNHDDATRLYQMLRPNGGASEAEINGTVGKRSFAGFVRDAQAEVQIRNNNLNLQTAHLAEMQTKINDQNQTITNLQTNLNNSELSNSDKKKALGEALAKIASSNADLATAHDQITDLTKSLPKSEGPPPPSLFTRLILLGLKFKK